MPENCGWLGLAGDTSRLLVGAVLLWAGMAKIARGGNLTEILEAFGVPFATVLGRHLAIATAGVEIAAALLVLTGIGGMPVLVATGALLLGFTGIVILLFQREYEGSCGCFGAGSGAKVGPTMILRNLTLLLLTGLALTASSISCSAGPAWNSSPTVFLLAALAFVSLAAAYALGLQVEVIVGAHRETWGKRGGSHGI